MAAFSNTSEQETRTNGTQNHPRPLRTDCQGAKFSIRWLSDSLNINRYTINKILRGEIRNDRDHERLLQVIEKLGYTEESFFQGATALARGRGTVPLFGDIPAGNPIWIEGKREPETWIEAPPFNGSRKLFALRVRGKSMEPRFQQGDIIYLEPLAIRMGVKDPENPVPKLTFERLNNRVVAAMVDGESTLKQLKIVPRGKAGKSEDYELHLLPLNSEFSTIVIDPTSTAEFQGVVVKMFRDEP